MASKYGHVVAAIMSRAQLCSTLLSICKQYIYMYSSVFFLPQLNLFCIKHYVFVYKLGLKYPKNYIWTRLRLRNGPYRTYNNRRQTTYALFGDENTTYGKPRKLRLGWRMGWNDIALFAIFENGHYAAGQVYFYESKSQRSVNLAARVRRKRGKVFIF